MPPTKPLHIFDAIISINPITDRLQLIADNIDGQRAHTYFPPSETRHLREWLQSPETWAASEPSPRAELMGLETAPITIAFSNETGKITVARNGASRQFDPHSEESLAAMVRHLKNLTPSVPLDAQPVLPKILPKVTEEDLRTKRTVYTAVASASGVSYKRSTTKERTASAEYTSKAIQSLFASGSFKIKRGA